MNAMGMHVSQSGSDSGIGLSQSTAVLATMHQKEMAIAPILLRELGLVVTVPADFNTDQFGTFTRDVPRLGTQIEAARRKAQSALKQSDVTVAIASEGAFFPHPSFPLVACDREIVMIIDAGNGLEIFGEVLSTTTNYRQATIRSVAEALKFAQDTQFPSHRLVVMLSADTRDTDAIVKGIATQAQFVNVVESWLRLSQTGTVHLETDMRAMYNPTRMGVISEATQALVKKMQQRCPACGCPGFSVVERYPGLPCGLCQLPTQLIRRTIQRCQYCCHEDEILFPDGQTEADPAQCWNCNP